MYKYNLIIKRGDLDEQATHAMVNQQLTRRFGPDVHYLISGILDNEVVVIVANESKRNLQNTLGDWFMEDQHVDGEWPVGSLLIYREILPAEDLYKRLGG